MAILITGAKGFVGRRLIFCLERYYKTVLFEGDISDKEQVESFKCFGKIDAVVHLAGVVDKKDKSLFYKVNVLGTENIIEFCKKVNAGRLVFVSSIKALSGFDDPYSNSKREAERKIVDSGVSYVILRPSILYGPGDKKNIGFFLRLARKLPFMPVFDFKMQPLFVDDLARVIVASLKIQESKIVNVVGPEIVSFKQFLDVLKSLKFEFRAVNLPAFFNFFLKIFSYFPFSPFRPWQVKSLLASDIIEDFAWQKIFNISATRFDEGILKTLNSEK